MSWALAIDRLDPEEPILEGDFLELYGSHVPLIPLLLPDLERFLADRVWEARRALLERGIDSDLDLSRRIGAAPGERAREVTWDARTGAVTWYVRLVLLRPQELELDAPSSSGPRLEAGLPAILAAAAALVAAVALLGPTWGRATLVRMAEEGSRTADSLSRAAPWIALAVVFGAIALLGAR